MALHTPWGTCTPMWEPLMCSLHYSTEYYKDARSIIEQGDKIHTKNHFVNCLRCYSNKPRGRIQSSAIQSWWRWQRNRRGKERLPHALKMFFKSSALSVLSLLDDLWSLVSIATETVRFNFACSLMVWLHFHRCYHHTLTAIIICLNCAVPHTVTTLYAVSLLLCTEMSKPDEVYNCLNSRIETCWNVSYLMVVV